MQRDEINNETYYCYVITNLINNKIYIGVSHKDIYIRFKEHIKVSNYKSNDKKQAIHLAINKYGKENFKIDILDKFSCSDDAYQAEIYYIEKFSSNNSKFGYNQSCGGDCGPINIKLSTELIKNVLKEYIEGKSIAQISKDCNINYNVAFDITRLRFSVKHEISNELINRVKLSKLNSKIKEKVTDDFALEICKNFIDGNTMQQISDINNISLNTVWNVLHKINTNKFNIPDDIVEKVLYKLNFVNKKHLTQNDVINIINDFILGKSVSILSNKYNINRNTIYAILKRKTWKNIVLSDNVKFELKSAYDKISKGNGKGLTPNFP